MYMVREALSCHPGKVGALVNCFPIWGGCVYCPDVHSSMIGEICPMTWAIVGVV